MGETMNLGQLKPGEKGRIIRVGGYGAIRRRLYDIGLHSGETVQMIKAAPLKDPLEISFGNGHVSIRRSEAALVFVEPVSE